MNPKEATSKDLDDSTLPPLILLPGHKLSQLAKRPDVGKASTVKPNSDNSFKAE